MRFGRFSLFCVAVCCQAEWKTVPPPPFDSAAKEPIWSIVEHKGGLWATTPHGLFASRDSGRTWRSARPSGFPRSNRVLGVTAAGRLFSAGGCLFATAPSGLSSTCDDGATWSSGDNPLGNIERLQGDSNLFVAGAVDDDEPFISTDKGRTWRMVTPFMRNGLGLDGIFQDGTRLWASAGSPFYSDDGGKSWQTSSAPAGGPNAFARQAGLLWVYGPFTPLAASADSGRTWMSRDVSASEVLGSLTSSGPVFVEGALFTSGTFDDPVVAAGVFMSLDTGKTWVTRNQGLPAYPRSPDDSVLSGGSEVFALGKVLLARTHVGIYRSEDLGAHWQAANTGVPAAVLRDGGLEALFLSAGRIYGRTTVGGSLVWYRSEDTARSWNVWDPGVPELASLTSSATTVLAFRNSDTVVSDPVYQSKDGMKTWSPLRGPWGSVPLPNPVAIYASGSHIYVAGDYVQSPSGLKRNYWHSPDEGASWESDSSLLYQEAYRWHAELKTVWFRNEGWLVEASTDSGRHWHASTNVGRVEESAIVDRILAVRVDTSLIVTNNNGQSWVRVQAGKDGVPAEGITALGGRFFAATRLGLRVSRNGLDWEDAEETGLAFREVWAIAASGDCLMAATGEGMFVSKDLGGHWQASALPQSASTPPAPPAAWLGVSKQAFVAGIPGRGIWVSSDTGRSWTPRYTPKLMGMWAGPDTLIFEDGTGSIAYAPDLSASPVIWGKLPAQGYENPSLAMADGGLYQAKTAGVYVSGAPAASWSQVKLPGAGPHDFLAGDGKRLAVSSADGPYIRAAAQSEWQSLGSGLPKDEISALSLDDGRLFAGLLNQGLWMNAALPDPLAHAAPRALLAGGPAIFPGADGNLVFRVNLSAPARLRLTLHSASGRTLADLSLAARPGLQELRPILPCRGIAFYRLEAEPESGRGQAQTFRGSLAPVR